MAKQKVKQAEEAKEKSKATTSKKVVRRAIRFKPDPGDYALVDMLNIENASDFRPTLLGLILEESAKGCGIVVLSNMVLKVGTFCRVKVGRGPALKAEVRWRKDLDEEVMRLGLLYLE
mgnify:FL=1